MAKHISEKGPTHTPSAWAWCKMRLKIVGLWFGLDFGCGRSGPPR